MRWQALSARTCYTAPDTSRHLESATILHRGAAAKLTQLGGAPCRLLRKGQTHLQVLARGAKHSPPECYTGPDTSTHLECATALHTVELLRACSIIRSSMTALLQRTDTSAGAWSRRQALSTRGVPPTTIGRRRARTLSLPPSCTVEQPQSLLDQSELHVMSVANSSHLQVPGRVAASTLHPSATQALTQARTLSLPPSCTALHTVELLQACLTSRSSMVSPSQRPDKPAGAWSRGVKHSPPECHQ